MKKLSIYQCLNNSFIFEPEVMKPLVQHTPMAERSKHNSGPGPRSITAHVNNSPPKLNGSLNTSSEANTSFNPLAGLTLWEQHESRPVLKHQT